ncbi:MAG: putative chromate transport protein [Candidatus Dichloromethanomonas elyunquensis]|nr:MAG: putative chromate transport protein [Candidatus Dichloromethanomonas elyunquensis]
MWKKYINVLLAFTRASNLGFGGGPAVVPLIQKEAVDRYHWMTFEEFADALAVGNTLPGPIATKLASYIGYKVAGWTGALLALIGTILPTLLITVFLGDIITRYANTPTVSAMLQAVRPVVVVLIAQSAYDLGKKAFPSKSTWVIGVIALATLYLLNLHPGILILIALIFGYFVYGKQSKKA